MRKQQIAITHIWMAFGALYITAFAGVVPLDEHPAQYVFTFGDTLVGYATLQNMTKMV